MARFCDEYEQLSALTGETVEQLSDLDTVRALVRLTEKGGTVRWQPVTTDLATALAEHARCRGAG